MNLESIRRQLGYLLLLVGALLVIDFAFDYFEPSIKSFKDRYTAAPVVPIPTPKPAPTPPTPIEVEAAIAAFAIPVGVVDGEWDQRTRQGLCIWRELTGRIINRDLPTAAEQIEIIESQFIALDYKFVVGVNVNKACQSAIWVKDATMKNFEIYPVSTGTEPGGTDVGNWQVTWKVNRWYESVQIPDGWMYKPIFFAYKGQAFHGSESDSFVHWYPASHGCVRMLTADIESLWDGGFGVGDQVRVYGDWKG